MKPDEIKKALECCVNKKCSECPIYCNDEYLGTTVIREVLDLINRQQAKIEELSEVLSDHIKIRVKEIKSEAIKEFAERVKENAIQIGYDPVYGAQIYVSVDNIDNLVKEMVGENNA
jgi:hypothetical protein